MAITTIFGILGSVIIILGFIYGTKKKKDPAFFVLNAMGSIFLLIHSIIINALPFGIINLAYFIISVREGINAYRPNRISG